MAIDVHAHYLPRGALEAFARGARWHGVDLGGGAEANGSSGPLGLPWQDPERSVEQRIADMDALGVDVQILSVTPRLLSYDLPAKAAAALAREVNDELAHVVACHPDRLAAFAHVPMQDPAAAVEELERSTSLGLHGVAVGSHVLGRDWDDDAVEPFLAACASLARFVFVHPHANRNTVGLGRRHLHNTIGNPLDTTVAVANVILGGVLDRHPRLRLCFAHGGGYSAFAIGRIGHAYQVRDDARGDTGTPPRQQLGRLFFDCITHDEAALRLLVDMVGADHVLLGSDYPADMGLRSPVEWLRHCTTLTGEEKSLVSSGNATREIPDIGLPVSPQHEEGCQT